MAEKINCKNFHESLVEKPFLHAQFFDFLNETYAEQLLQAVAKEEFIHKESDLFSFYQTNELSQNDLFKPSLSELKQFFEKNLKRTFSHIDCHATLYQDTNFLLCHDDQLDERKIAFLLYLTEVSEDEGGALVLFEKNTKGILQVAKEIQPAYNSLAFFEVSDISFHAVKEVVGNVQRIALGGWLS